MATQPDERGGDFKTADDVKSAPLASAAGSVLLYSKKWSNGIATWWGPDERGYTTDLKCAGRYTPEHAAKICADIHGDAIPIPESALEPLYVQHVVDEGWGHNGRILHDLIAQNAEVSDGAKPRSLQ